MRRRQQEDMSMGLGFGGLTQQYAANSYNQAQLRGNNAWRSANMKSGAAANRAGANILGMNGIMDSFGGMNFGGKNKYVPVTDDPNRVANLRSDYGMFSPYSGGSQYGNGSNPLIQYSGRSGYQQ